MLRRRDVGGLKKGKTTMTNKINSLLRVSLIGALAALTVPAAPAIALANGNAEYCEEAFLAGYVRTADIGSDCAGSRTLFFGNCAADAHFVFVTAEHRNGVTVIDCQLP
jgi:hypothetical protein